jgi:DNA-binding CsgD family transcriptional regulator
MRSRLSTRSRRSSSHPQFDDPIYAAAAAAFARADYAACHEWLALYRAQVPVATASAEILAARLARVEGDVEGWYVAASSVALRSATPGEAATGLALRALAARDAGSEAEADELLRDLLTQLPALEPNDAVYPGYLVAFDAWHGRDYERAEVLALENLVRDPKDPETLALLGWIDVKRERFRAAGKLFTQALAALRNSGVTDMRLQGRLVHAISVVASETVDLRMGKALRREYQDVNWSEPLRVDQFNTLTCLRFLDMLEGDLEGAWVFSRSAAALAPSPAYVAIGETNAAVAARSIGDEAASGLQFRRAWDVLRTERWSAADAEARVALTNFACEAARAMPAEARKALILYRSLQGKQNRANSLDGDRRIAASETWAAARVAEAIGERDETFSQYRESLAVWTELGFVMRAAAVAHDLYRVTRDDVYLQPIAALTELAPNNWLARTVPEAGSPLSRLRPAQLKVLAGLLRGDSAKAIAEELGRSQYTVINHTRTIFAAFRVHNRADVRRACARAGITLATLEAVL